MFTKLYVQGRLNAALFILTICSMVSKLPCQYGGNKFKVSQWRKAASVGGRMALAGDLLLTLMIKAHHRHTLHNQLIPASISQR